MLIKKLNINNNPQKLFNNNDKLRKIVIKKFLVISFQEQDKNNKRNYSVAVFNVEKKIYNDFNNNSFLLVLLHVILFKKKISRRRIKMLRWQTITPRLSILRLCNIIYNFILFYTVYFIFTSTSYHHCHHHYYYQIIFHIFLRTQNRII